MKRGRLRRQDMLLLVLSVVIGALAGCAMAPMPVASAPDDPGNPRAAEGSTPLVPSAAPVVDAGAPAHHHHHAP